MNEQDKQAFETWWKWSKFKLKADMKELQQEAWQGALEYRDARHYDTITTLELENRMIRERNERLESETEKAQALAPIVPLTDEEIKQAVQFGQRNWARSNETVAAISTAIGRAIQDALIHKNGGAA